PAGIGAFVDARLEPPAVSSRRECVPRHAEGAARLIAVTSFETASSERVGPFRFDRAAIPQNKKGPPSGEPFHCQIAAEGPQETSLCEGTPHRGDNPAIRP